MHILFDNGTPRPLRGYLRPHAVTTVEQKGWQQLKNGELLRSAVSTGFDVIITTDTNWPYQQDLTKFPTLAIIVLRETNWKIIRPKADTVKEALDHIQPGNYIELKF